MGAVQNCYKADSNKISEIETEDPIRYMTLTKQATLFNEMIMKNLLEPCKQLEEINFNKIERSVDQAEIIEDQSPQISEKSKTEEQSSIIKNEILDNPTTLTPKDKVQKYLEENIHHERVPDNSIFEDHLLEIYNRAKLSLNFDLQVEDTVFPMFEPLKIPDLGIYKGELNIDQEPHGRGLLLLSNDSTFIGYFKKGFPEGPGKYLDNEKVLREGNFVTVAEGTRKSGRNAISNFVLHGYGVESWPNKVVYKGNFNHGTKEGEGELVFSEGTYQGQFSNDVFHGVGKLVFKNQDVYHGEWKNGIKHGAGEFKAKNGSVYKGNFVDGERSGKGVMVWAATKAYDDERPDRGIKESLDKKVYDGEWFNGKKHGIAKYTFYDKKKARMRTSYSEWNEGVRIRWIKKNEIH